MILVSNTIPIRIGESKPEDGSAYIKYDEGKGNYLQIVRIGKDDLEIFSDEIVEVRSDQSSQLIVIHTKDQKEINLKCGNKREQKEIGSILATFFNPLLDVSEIDQYELGILHSLLLELVEPHLDSDSHEKFSVGISSLSTEVLISDLISLSIGSELNVNLQPFKDSLKTTLQSDQFLKGIQMLFSAPDCMNHALTIVLHWKLSSHLETNDRVSSLHDFMLTNEYLEAVTYPVKCVLLAMTLEECTGPGWLFSRDRLSGAYGNRVTVHSPFMWKILLDCLPLCDDDILQSLLSEINSLLIFSVHNCNFIIDSISNWQDKFIPFLAHDSAIAALAMNALATLHLTEFWERDTFPSSLYQSIEAINLRIDESSMFEIDHISQLFECLIAKLNNSKQKSSFTVSSDCKNLIELTNMIKGYVFYSPVIGSSTIGIESQISAKSNFGLHIDDEDGDDDFIDFRLMKLCSMFLQSLNLMDRGNLLVSTSQEKIILAKLQRRLEFFFHGVSFFLVLQFKKEFLTLDEISEFAKKFTLSRSFSRRMTSVFNPLLEFPKPKLNAEEIIPQFDSLITAQFCGDKTHVSIVQILDKMMAMRVVPMNGRVFSNCFTGADAVSILGDNKHLSENNCILLGTVFLSAGVFQNVEKEVSYPFVNQEILYRFSKKALGQLGKKTGLKMNSSFDTDSSKAPIKLSATDGPLLRKELRKQSSESSLSRLSDSRDCSIKSESEKRTIGRLRDDLSDEPDKWAREKSPRFKSIARKTSSLFKRLTSFTSGSSSDETVQRGHRRHRSKNNQLPDLDSIAGGLTNGDVIQEEKN